MIRHALHGLLNAGILLVLLLAGAVILVQTGPGKRVLATQLTALLSSPNSGIEITGIQGWIPLDMRIERLRLLDQAGTWLEASDVALDWSPSALFGRRLQIESLRARRVHVMRLPEGSQEMEPPADEPFRLPELPKSLPPLTVADLAIEEIALDPPVLGEDARFALDGSLAASDDGGKVDLSLDLQRLDQATAFLTLTSTIGLDPPMLAIDLDAGETGNLLKNLTRRDEAGNLDLSLTGNGPLGDWSGKLGAHADGLGTAEADLALGLVGKPSLAIEAVLRLADQALPAEVRDLLGDRLDLSLAVTQNQAQAIAIERFDIAADQLEIEGAGKVDFAQGDIALKAGVDAPDLRALSTLAGRTLSGGAGLTLDLGGTLEQPKGSIDIRGSSLGLDGIDIADLTTTIDWQAKAPLTSEHASFDVQARGSAGGLEVRATTLPDDTMAWEAALDVPLEGTIVVRQATVDMAGATLSTEGSFDPTTLISDLDVRLQTPALQRLLAPYGQTIDGRALITAAIKTTSEAEEVSIDLEAALSGLANLPEGAKELLGDKLDLEADIALDKQRFLGISDLNLNGAALRLAGQGKLDLESQDLSGDLNATLPRLAVLASSIEQPMEGALELEASISGNLEAPIADLAVKGKNLNLAGQPIETLALSLTGQDLATTPEGKLKLDLIARTMPLTLALDYRLDNDLALPNISLEAPATAVDGAVTIDLDTALVDGWIKGSITDLAALRPLLEMPLQGSVDLDADLMNERSRQHANLAINGREIEGDFGRISKVDMTAAIQDLLGEATISAETRLQDLEQDAFNISALRLDAQGSQESLAIALDLEGEVVQPLALKAGGRLSLNRLITLDIDRLNGSFAGETLALKEPVHIEQGDESLELSNLNLRLGSASLGADVDIGQRDVEGEIRLQAFPLEWLEKLDGPSINGLAQARIDLGGTVQRPEIEATLDLSNVSTDNVAGTNFPPIDATIDADLKNGRLTSSLQAKGLTEQPITARAAHPLNLELRPFVLALPEDGALEGKVDATIQLARIGDLLALDEQVLKGVLDVDLELAGTLTAPLIEGPITLENGAYENSFTGTVFRDLAMEANASSERITVNQLKGRIGQDGTVDAKGWIDLDPEASFPLSVSVTLDEAKLISRDDVEATIAGDLALRGDLNDALIKGDLVVQRAEISIPEGGGPDLPDIEVEEVGANIVNSAEPQDGGERPFDPELDLNIDLPNQIYVRGRGLESEWQGNLALAGPTSEPRITGNLSVKKGYFDFIEKRFEIEQGSIDFKGTSPPNPILEIRAAATDGDFKAIIKLDGPAQEPKLSLDSEPVLPEDEVLARLLFNRELSEIGPIEAGKLALALNKLRGGGGFDAFGGIRDTLKIDTLDIVGGEDATDSKVKAGKYLSDDVYLEVEQGAAGDSSRARVEVEILPNVALEADTGDDANGGVGLKWRFDY